MEELYHGEMGGSELALRLGDGGGHGRCRNRAGTLASGRFLGGFVEGVDGTLSPDPQTLATEVDDVVARLRMPRKPSVEGRHTTSLQ